jgi:hypothetical protein
LGATRSGRADVRPDRGSATSTRHDPGRTQLRPSAGGVRWSDGVVGTRPIPWRCIAASVPPARKSAASLVRPGRLPLALRQPQKSAVVFLTRLIESEGGGLVSRASCTAVAPQPVFQLRIRLEGVDPVIWRRLLVPGAVRDGETPRHVPGDDGMDELPSAQLHRQ